MIPAVSTLTFPTDLAAPVLVLGPSLGTSTDVWAAAAELLVRDFTVVCWDLPGHGASSPATEPFDLPELADAVAAQVDSDGYFYAGVSLGGAVGLHLALRDERMRGAAAICSGAVIGTPAAWHDRASLVRAAGTSTLVPASRERWFGPGEITTSEQRLLDDLPSIDGTSYALCCEALATHDLRAELRRITVPVLAAWGEYDQVTPAASSEEIATGVRVGKAHRIASAGHLAPVERPDEVASMLKEYFASISIA